MNVRICKVEGCERDVASRNVCGMHYKRLRARGTTELVRYCETPCRVDSCPRKGQSKGYCSPHYKRLCRYGSPTYVPPRTDYTDVDLSLYGVWWAMKNRCYRENNKSFADYGGRGIRVCQRWRTSYIAYIDDLGPRPRQGMSLDRPNNDGGYTCGKCDECSRKHWPRNLRWADKKHQARNTRANHLVAVDGVTRTIAEWTELRGFGKGTISDRLASGWSERDAVMKPRRR